MEKPPAPDVFSHSLDKDGEEADHAIWSHVDDMVQVVTAATTKAAARKLAAYATRLGWGMGASHLRISRKKSLVIANRRKIPAAVVKEIRHHGICVTVGTRVADLGTAAVGGHRRSTFKMQARITKAATRAGRASKLVKATAAARAL